MSFRGSCTRNGVGSRTGEGNSIFADPLLGSHEAMESPVSFAMAAWVSSRLLLWAEAINCQSNRRGESRMEQVVVS